MNTFRKLVAAVSCALLVLGTTPGLAQQCPAPAPAPGVFIRGGEVNANPGDTVSAKFVFENGFLGGWAGLYADGVQVSPLRKVVTSGTILSDTAPSNGAVALTWRFYTTSAGGTLLAESDPPVPLVDDSQPPNAVTFSNTSANGTVGSPFHATATENNDANFDAYLVMNNGADETATRVHITGSGLVNVVPLVRSPTAAADTYLLAYDSPTGTNVIGTYGPFHVGVKSGGGTTGVAFSSIVATDVCHAVTFHAVLTGVSTAYAALNANNADEGSSRLTMTGTGNYSITPSLPTTPGSLTTELDAYDAATAGNNLGNSTGFSVAGPSVAVTAPASATNGTAFSTSYTFNCNTEAWLGLTYVDNTGTEVADGSRYHATAAGSHSFTPTHTGTEHLVAYDASSGGNELGRSSAISVAASGGGGGGGGSNPGGHTIIMQYGPMPLVNATDPAGGKSGEALLVAYPDKTTFPTARPVIMVVHGGSFVHGDSIGTNGTSYNQIFAQTALDEGYAVAYIDYDENSNEKVGNKKVSFNNEQVIGMQLAARFLRQNRISSATDYTNLQAANSLGLDGRICADGESAGGTLVAMMGALTGTGTYHPPAGDPVSQGADNNNANLIPGDDSVSCVVDNSGPNSSPERGPKSVTGFITKNSAPFHITHGNKPGTAKNPDGSLKFPNGDGTVKWEDSVAIATKLDGLNVYEEHDWYWDGHVFATLTDQQKCWYMLRSLAFVQTYMPTEHAGSQPTKCVHGTIDPTGHGPVTQTNPNP